MEAKEANSERPPDSDFQQQNLKAWQPLLTPSWVIVTFFLVSLVFIPIGAVILETSKDVKTEELRYDEMCPFEPRALANRTCLREVNITITETMKKPVYFYYKLTNFYQNHRRYVKSRDDQQLRGDTSSDLSSCDPLSNYKGQQLYPCGLVANSYFNDTFTMPVITRNAGKVNVTWTDKGIAWDSDVKDKFKKLTVAEIDAKGWTRTGPGGYQLPDVDKEDFIVWMRTAGLPTFKKLRYIINQDLQKGDVLKINVLNAFPVKGFSGEKYIVLSTTSWLGGQNKFLGFAYLVVGGLCFMLALLFLIKHVFYERPLGDMHYFNWHNNRERKE